MIIFVIGFISIIIGFFIGTFVEQNRWECHCSKDEPLRIGKNIYCIYKKQYDTNKRFITKEKLDKEIDEQLKKLSNDYLDKKWEEKLKNYYRDYKS